MSAVPGQPVRLTSFAPGAGCACKLPLAKLDGLFAALGTGLPPAAGDLLVGALDGDDAAVLRLDGDRAMVLTTDFFTPLVDDPVDWGRIAVANALSDVYAMGGRPLIAVNLTAWPAGELPIELLAEVLRGGLQVAGEAGCLVAGGHTIDDPVPKYGLAVVGMADPDRLLTIDRVADGDRLVLTKAIGTGVVTTALKRDGCPDPAVERAAVASMTRLNASASSAALAAGVLAATDVTGFGLIGHLHRMLRASGLAGEVHAGQVPLLPGVLELAAGGFVPGGTRANLDYLAPHVRVEPGVPPDLAVLLHDAQTSGGLLLAVPPDRTGALVAELAGLGWPATVVGRARAGTPGQLTVTAGG